MSKQRNPEQVIWHLVPMVALVIWGVLCITDNLWYDEAFSAALVALPFKKMLYITAVDAHSPFYYTMLKIFYTVLGGGTKFYFLKLFSLLFMAGYLLLGKYYVKKLFDREVSIWFCAFSALFPIMSVQAGNVRMYAVALFFMTLMGLAAYDWYLSPKRGKWIVFCLASVCTVYCHTFAMLTAFWFYILLFVAILLGKKKELLKGYFLSGFVVAFTFLPWLFVTARQMTLRMRYDTGSVSEKATLMSFFEYLKEWFSALETPIPLVVILEALICLILLSAGVVYVIKEKKWAPLCGLLALIFTIATGFLVSVFINNCFLGRYVFPGFGFFLLFYAVGMKALHHGIAPLGEKSAEREKILRRLGMSFILGILLLCFTLQYVSECNLEYDKGRGVFDDFMEEVEPEDMVLCSFAHTGFLSVYYPERTFYIDGYKPYKMPFENVLQLDSHDELKKVKGDIWYLHFQNVNPTDFPGYELIKVKEFHYMYYDFVIYKLCSKK